MLPRSIDFLLRAAGILISVFFALSPWFLSTEMSDTFFNQSWILFGSGIISVCLLSVIFLFFRPRDGQIPFLKAGFALYIVIVISTLLSPFLTSLRTSLIWASQLLLLFFLRLSRKSSDNGPLVLLVILNGILMGIYSICQNYGLDVFQWVHSSCKVIGTFSNPNYLATYLTMTGILSLGVCLELKRKPLALKIFLFIGFLIQAFALYLTNCQGAILTLFIGIFLLMTSFWEIKPGKVLKTSSVLSGIVLAILITLFHGIIFYSTTTYPWNEISQPPYKYFPMITRLLDWQMGFSIFLNHPFTGLGPGGAPYLMTTFRPRFGTALGLSIFTDNPHSVPISILAELGFFGLLAICTLFVIFIGIHNWKRFRSRINGKEKEAEDDFERIGLFQILPTLLIAFISIALYLSKTISLNLFLLSIPFIIGVFSISLMKFSLPINSKTDGKFTKALAVSALCFLCNSLFNNNLVVLPLTNLLVLILSLHISSCLNNIVWKKKFTYLSLAYLFFPVLFVFASFALQSSYAGEQKALFKGANYFSKQDYIKSADQFKKAIKANPQSLQAHYGLAISLENSGKIDESQSTLVSLDAIVPNVFNTNFELARILFERKLILEAHRYALKSLSWNRSPKTFELLGKILLAEGKISEAEQIFKEGLIFVPSNNHKEAEAADRIKLKLCALYSERGDFEKSENLLKNINSVVKNSGESLYLNGMLAFNKGNASESLKLFEKALKQAPDNPKFMNAVGFNLVNINSNLERAQLLLEKAHQKFNQGHPPLLSDLLMISHSLGILYWKQNKTSQAEELLELAFSQCPIEWKSLRAKRYKDYKDFLKATNNETKLLEVINKYEHQSPSKNKKE